MPPWTFMTLLDFVPVKQNKLVLQNENSNHYIVRLFFVAWWWNFWEMLLVYFLKGFRVLLLLHKKLQGPMLVEIWVSYFRSTQSPAFAASCCMWRHVGGDGTSDNIFYSLISKAIILDLKATNALIVSLFSCVSLILLKTKKNQVLYNSFL